MAMDFDYVLVGGGLQNALVALALFAHRPAARVALVERAERLGGNHLWSFHAGDVPEDARGFVEPLVVARWPGWEVIFPELRRSFDAGYASVSSERLHDVLVGAFEGRDGCAVLTGRDVATVLPREVILRDGTSLRGRVVIDARGPDPALDRPVAWQKFVGLELSVRSAAPVPRPIIMDATVAQTDGFRFFYVLPLAPDRVMVEDTYYADGDALDVPAIRAGIVEYAERIGLDVTGVAREEVGALPLPLEYGFAPSYEAPLVAGYRGGFFHPTTGYSFPVAVRLARHVATAEPDDLFGSAWRTLVDRHGRQVRFGLLLNRLLFGATPEHHRRDVLERFHRLPEATIRRFYALETTASDRARVVCGRPPKGVSIRAALAQVVRS